MDFTALLNVLGAGLSIWDSKEKTKYQDQYVDLKRKYYEASNKPDDERDDAVISNLRVELRILADSFVAAVKK